MFFSGCFSAEKRRVSSTPAGKSPSSPKGSDGLCCRGTKNAVYRITESSRSEETSRPSSPTSARTISPKTPELEEKPVWPSRGALTQLAGGRAGLQAVPVGHGARLDAAAATGRAAAGYKTRPRPAAPRGQSPPGGCGPSSPGHARAIAGRTPPGQPPALMRGLCRWPCVLPGGVIGSRHN